MRMKEETMNKEELKDEYEKLKYEDCKEKY